MASYDKAFCEVAKKFKISCFNGNDMYVGNTDHNNLIEMLHSCTPSTNKEYIIKSFGQECGGMNGSQAVANLLYIPPM